MKDRTRIKNLSGMGQLIMDINSKRVDSEVYINQKLDITELVKYVEKRKADGNPVTYFHAFVAAIGKVIYNRPKLNYFVSNRHLYKHNDVVLAFTAKVQFDDSSEELMFMIPIKENDNVNTISKYIKDKIDKVRARHEERIDTGSKKGANSAIDIVGKLPNIIRIPVVGFLKWMDSIGYLPKSLKEDNLYYSTMVISNIGSLHCGGIYHHLSDFGTSSGLITIGEIKDEVVIKDGKEEIRKMAEFGITIDERIADGYYFIKSVQLLQKILDNPESLEKPAGEEINTTEIVK